MERIGLRGWLIALAAVIVVFAGTAVVLSFTVFSAQGFVSSYLNALARHDVSDALATPGVDLPPAGSRTLLRGDVMGGLDDIHLVSDATEKNGRHRLLYSYSSGGQTGRTTFTVERDGTHLGLFPAWRFVTSPVSVLDVTPLHDATFTINGLDLTSKAGASVTTGYLVLAPSRFTLSHTSAYLTAPKTSVFVTAPSSRVAAPVDIQANHAFVAIVQKELDKYLATCVTQTVLMPTGCPMGQPIQDRLQGTPAWSMVTNPTVTIIPGNSPGTWLMPGTEGVAHLVVPVKSIFDGSVSTFDHDVPFSVAYLISFQADGSITVAPRY